MKKSLIHASGHHFAGVTSAPGSSSMLALVLPSLMQNFAEAGPPSNGFASSMIKRLRQNGRPEKHYVIGPLFESFRRYRSWMRKLHADLNGHGEFYD